MSKLEELLKRECPDGVEYKNLDEIVDILDNLRKPVSKDKRTKGSYPYYGANGIQDYVDNYLFDGTFILMGEDGSVINKDNSPVLNWASGKIWVNNHAHVLFNEDINILRFVFYYLQTIDVSSIVRGTPPKINQQNLRNIVIPFPPIEVQKEIVGILDTFTKYQDLLNRELELRKKQYEYYREKLLTFNDDVEWKCLGELLQPKGYIRGPFGSALKKDFFVKDGVPVYEQQHAIYNKRVFRYFVDCERADKLKRFTVKPYDIIISCSGTIGKISIIMPEDRIGIINQALLILRLDLSKVNVKYIKHYLECFPNLIVTSSGGAITNIEKREIIEKIKIPVPQLEEQERIVNILDKFDALCNDITKGLPAEIEMRKKQYEYYRDKLLTFKEKKC